MAEKQYTITESIEALSIDPKTFRRWLTKAGIDPEKQRSAIDERMRYLTEAQLRGLAEAHGRTWPPQPRTRQADQLPTTPGAFKQLVTNLVSAQVSPVEQEQSEQVEQIQEHSRILAEILVRLDRAEQAAGSTLAALTSQAAQIADQARRIQALEDARLADQERMTDLERQIQALAAQIKMLEYQTAQIAADQAAHIASLAEQIAGQAEQIQTMSQPRAARRQHADQAQARAGELEPGLVGAAEFAEAHGINAGTAKSAFQTGRIPTRRGKWRGPGRRPITVALDAEGQRRFHEIYHQAASFQACPDCPHFQDAGDEPGPVSNLV